MNDMNDFKYIRIKNSELVRLIGNKSIRTLEEDSLLSLISAGKLSYIGIKVSWYLKYGRMSDKINFARFSENVDVILYNAIYFHFIFQLVTNGRFYQNLICTEMSTDLVTLLLSVMGKWSIF